MQRILLYAALLYRIGALSAGITIAADRA